MTVDVQSHAGEISVTRLDLQDGAVQLPAAVYRPAGTPRPTVVLLAPGGLARGDLETSRWAGERLAAAGYVALAATYRAAAPYDDVRDLRLGLDWLQQDAGTEGPQLVVVGRSRGGLATLCLAAEDPRVQAVVAIAPPVDIAVWVQGLAGFAPAAREAGVQFMGGAPGDVPEQYERVRGLSLADRIRQPVLLIHGTGDMRVPPEHSVWMERALRDAGNERVRLELVPGMGHFLELSTLGYQFDRVVGLITAWLDEQLA